LHEDDEGLEGSELLKSLGSAPYGYAAGVVKACVAGLLRDGKIESIEDADQPQVEATVHFQPVIQPVIQTVSASVSPLVAEQVVQTPTEPDLNPTETAVPVADPVSDTSPSAPPEAATPAGSEAPAPADAPFRLVEEDTVLTELPDKPTQPPVAARAE
jgi:hypothetical protein